ncbi:MAG: ATP-binding cassette domain-containing protein [Clostridia bacterium]|nr:ATP-binding cassette domain-containing protein [Clostridia bacterium]MDY5556001.1 ATP-binding cassette domain-containing protein [Blautia sp.]
MKIYNVCKKYEDHLVLDHLNMTLEEGKIYALMGPSGCGKTTLLHIILGILKPDEGTIELPGKRRLSAVFQENRLFDFMTAWENIAVVQEKAHNVNTINTILKEILPEECLTQKVSEFSGGMKRRVAIARAMMTESDLIVMDEPLTGLDEETKDQVISFIMKYRNGRTLIFSTHQENEVGRFEAKKIMIGS